MNSVERVKHICKERKIPISKLEKDLGFSNGYISQLRKGTFPSDRIIKISEYLNVSIDYLMNGVVSNETELNTKDDRDISKDLESIMRKITNGENGPASFEGEEIPEDDLELFAGQLELMLRRLKSINKEKYNPYKNKK